MGDRKPTSDVRRIRPIMPRLAVALMALVLIGTPTLIVAAAMPSSVRPAAVLGFLIITLTSFFRGFRLELQLRDDGVLIRNYRRDRFMRWEDVAAIVSARQLAPALGQAFNGCAAFISKSGNKEKALATMSWGWRFGGASKQAQRIAEAIQSYGRQHSVEVQLKAEDLI